MNTKYTPIGGIILVFRLKFRSSPAFSGSYPWVQRRAKTLVDGRMTMVATKSLNNRVFVIGASAGGIETMLELLRLLPQDFPAPILLVIHTAMNSPGLLARVLQRESGVLVVNAKNGKKIQSSHIYVAPPNFHLVVEGDRVRLMNGTVENRHRPAIDPLFRSAARSLGSTAVGVILSGYLDDGCAGLLRIKAAGGTTIVQSPEDALVPYMPRNALERVNPDYVVPVRELVPLMSRLAESEVQVQTARKDY